MTTIAMRTASSTRPTTARALPTRRRRTPTGTASATSAFCRCSSERAQPRRAGGSGGTS